MSDKTKKENMKPFKMYESGDMTESVSQAANLLSEQDHPFMSPKAREDFRGNQNCIHKINIDTIDGLPVSISLELDHVTTTKDIRNVSCYDARAARTRSLTIGPTVNEDTLEKSPLLAALANFSSKNGKRKDQLYAVQIKAVKQTDDGEVESFFTINGKHINKAGNMSIQLIPSKEDIEELSKHEFIEIVEVDVHGDSLDGQLARLQNEIQEFSESMANVPPGESTAELFKMKSKAELYIRLLKKEINEVGSLIESAESELCKQLFKGEAV